MTCRELAEVLLEYVGGELAPEQCEGIRQHLALCPPCVHYVATYRLTITLTRTLPAAAMPPEMATRLQAALREAGSGPSDSTTQA